MLVERDRVMPGDPERLAEGAGGLFHEVRAGSRLERRGERAGDGEAVGVGGTTVTVSPSAAKANSVSSS